MEERLAEINSHTYSERYKTKQKKLIQERRELNNNYINRLRKIFPNMDITLSSQSIKIYLSGNQIVDFVEWIEKLSSQKNEQPSV